MLHSENDGGLLTSSLTISLTISQTGEAIGGIEGSAWCSLRAPRPEREAAPENKRGLSKRVP